MSKGTIQQLTELEARIEEYKRTVISQERDIDKLESERASLVGYHELHTKYMLMVSKLIDKVGYYE